MNTEATNTLEPWKNSVIRELEGAWGIRDKILLQSRSPENTYGYSEIDYEAILNDPYRTVSGEYPYYVKAIKEALSRLHDREESVIADLGCGDGRFTRMLLAEGCSQVVAMDISPENLRRLRDRLIADSVPEERYLLVEGDIANPPFKEGVFDLVMAVGVLLVLNDGYGDGVQGCAHLLKPGGILLTIDPTDFGAAMYAISRHDLRELEQVAFEGTKTVDIADPLAPRYSVRSTREMQEAHKRAGMDLLSTSGIPIFPSLVFGAMKQLCCRDPQDWPRLKKVAEKLMAISPDAWRAACVLSRKKIAN